MSGQRERDETPLTGEERSRKVFTGKDRVARIVLALVAVIVLAGTGGGHAVAKPGGNTGASQQVGPRTELNTYIYPDC
jgi:hypothetical protein